MKKRIFHAGIPVKKKRRPDYRVSDREEDLRPGGSVFPIARPTDLEPPRGSVMQPRRGRVATSPGACTNPGTLATVDPGGVPSGQGDPQTGARAWRSLLALSPACGHHSRARSLRHTRAPRTAALGIPGLHAASLMGLWDSSPPSAFGSVFLSLSISVPSAVQLRLALRRLRREHGVTAPAHRGNHGIGAAAPSPWPFCLRPTDRPTETAQPRASQHQDAKAR